MSQEKIIAALDIGSYSLLMLIARQTPTGEIKHLNEVVAVTRLGEDLAKSGVLSEEAMTRTLKAAREMHEIALKEEVEDFVVTAGSSIKIANNRSAFLVKCHQALGVYPQVLSAKEEAKLAFMGASLNIENHQPVVMITIGGGSTHIAYGEKDRLINSYSFDTGYVKLNEKFNLGQGSNILRQKAAQNYIKKALLKTGTELDNWLLNIEPTVLLSGGTATSFASILNKEIAYDRNQVNSTMGTRKEVSSMLKTIAKIKLKERYKIPGLDMERAEIIPAGLLMINTILKHFKFDKFHVSSTGLKTGIIRYFLN